MYLFSRLLTLFASLAQAQGPLRRTHDSEKIPLLETKTCPPYRSSELYLGHACVLTVLLHVCISFLLGYDYGNAWIQIACFQIPVF